MTKQRTVEVNNLLTEGAQSSAAQLVRRCDSRELFGDARELLIMHAGSEYRLRLTSQGKLILTK